MLDEYFEKKKNIDIKKKEIDNIKNKFKELKSLIYEYKDNKDNEIKSLKAVQENLNNELTKNNNNYNEILDSATNQIESFLKKLDKNNPIL